MMHPRSEQEALSLPDRVGGAAPNGIGPLRRARSLVGAMVCFLAIAGSRLPAADIPTAIFVMRIDGSEVRKVAQVEGYKKHGSPQWSHDGKRLAFDAYEGPADAKKFFAIDIDGSKLQELGEHALPHWSPDDKQIAFQNYGKGGIRPGIWVQNVDGKGRNWLADGFCPRWSPDGSQIAFINPGQGLHLLDLVEGGERNLLDEPFENISGGFDWSPDGKRLAFMGDRNARRELVIVSADGASKGLSVRLVGDMSGNVAWSPDGKRLAFSQKQQIHWVDAEGDKPPTRIPGQQRSNREPAWSPDGQWIAFSSERTALAAPQKPLVRRPPLKLDEVTRHAKGMDVSGLAFTPDGSRAVIGGTPSRKGIRIWTLGNDQARDFDLAGAWIAMSPDGRQFATAALSQKILLVDLETGEVQRELHPGDVTSTLSYSKSGTRLVSGGLDKQAHVWNTQTGKEVCAFKNHQDWVTSARLSPDGKSAVSVSHDATLRVWDAETAVERLVIAHPEPIWGLAVSPDGSQILTGTGGPLVKRSSLILDQGNDNTLRLWNAVTGQLVREMKGHAQTVFTIDISPDGTLAASGGFDGAIRLWDLETGAELSRVQGESGVMQVKFSPDGSHLLAAGGLVRLPGRPMKAVPSEQVRLYQLIENSDANTAAATENP